jgi:hypothetical protein
MSIDQVDDLEAAEDYIGAARRAAFDVIGAWHRTDEELRTSPPFIPVIRSLHALLAAITDPFIRPSCDDGCCAGTCGGHHPDDPDPVYEPDDDGRAKTERDERRLDALDDIVAILSGTDWEASTLEEVAEVLRRAGYTIDDFDEGGEHR